MARPGMRCLACGFLYEVAEKRHHCEHCFADTTYLRALGVHHNLRNRLAPQERTAAHG